MTNIIGIDFSGAKSDRNTWVAQGSLHENGALILHSAEMTRRSDVSELLKMVSTPAVAAIDFPFGVPQKFAEFLKTADDIMDMRDVWEIVANLSQEEFIAARDDFFPKHGEPKREGDEAYLSESFSPLHKGNPSMLQMTHCGIKMLYKLHQQCPNRWIVPPLHSSGSVSLDRVTLLETMPGAALNALGTIYKGYKNPNDPKLRIQRRDRILDALETKSGVELPNLHTLRDECQKSDDCLDAIVAAVVAAVWAYKPERFHYPAHNELEAAELEGWIYIPDCRHASNP